jgi:hypothetical protein
VAGAAVVMHPPGTAAGGALTQALTEEGAGVRLYG